MNAEEKETSFDIWRLVTTIYRTWYKEAEKELANEDVSLMEYRILRQLSETGQQPMVTIAEANMITQGWVTSLIDRLEKRKYVERVRSTVDRRIVNINATEEGIKFYKKVVDIHEGFVANTLDFLPYDEKTTLRATLAQIQNHLMHKDRDEETTPYTSVE